MNETNNYASVYDAVGLDSTLQEIALGRTRIPLMRVRTPFACYGFPPTLIPLWSDGSTMTYVGLWKHWFTPRQATFVECYLEEDCRVYEIARNPVQLLHVLGLEILCASQGDRGELEDFVGRCGAGIDIDALERVAGQTGDDPTGLLACPFSSRILRSRCAGTGSSTGRLPRPKIRVRDAARLRASCTLEVPDGFLQAVRRDADHSGYPPWYLVEEVQRLFTELLASRNLGGAWLSLNCHGWDYVDTKQALTALSRVAGDAPLITLADAWASLDHGAGGGY